MSDTSATSSMWPHQRDMVTRQNESVRECSVCSPVWEVGRVILLKSFLIPDFPPQVLQGGKTSNA